MASAAIAPVSAPVAPLRRDEVLMVAGGALLLIDIAFFVLGRYYYLDKLDGSYDMVAGVDPDAMVAKAAWAATKATFFWSFLVFSTLGTIAITAAVLWPREVGHGLATGFGLLFLVSAGFVFFHSHMPVLVGVLQATIGALLLRLTVASWLSKDRAAWAFMLSLCAVLAITMFFGAPKIRAAIGVHRLWYVMLLPAVMTATATGFYRLRRDY